MFNKNILILLAVIVLVHVVVICSCMSGNSEISDKAAAAAAEEFQNRQLAFFDRLFSAERSGAVSRPGSAASSDRVPEPWEYGSTLSLPLNLQNQAKMAKSVIVVDLNSRRVLFERNSQTAVPIASLTKLMSLLVVSDKLHSDPQLDLKQVITLSETARSVENARLKAGKYLFKDLMYSMIVGSFNDAATQLAISCSGSVPAFVDEMNRKAGKMGLKHAKFNSPSGLPQEGVNSFAATSEVLYLCEAVMQDPDLRKICGTPRYTLSMGSKRRGGNSIGSDNQMINGRKVDGAFGFKTGFTNAAGRCVAFGVERNGRVIIGCITGYSDKTKLFDFAIALNEWAFKQNGAAK